MLRSAFVGAVAALAGAGFALWTAYNSAPTWLAATEDYVARSAQRLADMVLGAPKSLDESIVELTADELKVKSLPAPYRYHPFPYPLAARWDLSGPGVCQMLNWAREIPSPGSKTYAGTDTSVDVMYGQFLASIEPPAGDAALSALFDSYQATRKHLHQLEREVRQAVGNLRAREIREMRQAAERSHLELAAQLQSAMNADTGLYARALEAYVNDAYQQTVNCGSHDMRLPLYTVRESLSDFRAETARNAAVVSMAELVQLSQAGSDDQDEETRLGTARVELSFRKVRIFHLDAGPWFSREAVLAFADKLRPGSPRLWGDEGAFPLMPVGVLALTEPVLRVKLSPEQAREVRALLTQQQSLKVGSFRFDFTQPNSYRALSDDGSLRTEIEFTAPRGEVVVLGLLSVKPEVRP